MKQREFSHLKIVTLIISEVIGTVVFLLIALFLLVYFGVFGPLPENDVLKGINNEEASLVYSSDGALIGKYFARNRTNIKWEDVPDHLKQALISTEDKRFFDHGGFDTRSYLRVFFRSIILRDRSGGGGSTLTQQLIKNLYGRGDHGFMSMPVNKIKEAIIAARMEKIYSKEELLLLYLNSVPFGEDVYGIQTASQRYFNKAAKDLKIEESAVLIGMLKANTYFNPRLNPKNSTKRRNLVLSLMSNEGYLNSAEVDSLKNIPLNLNYENFKLEAPAGYFVYQVKKRVLKILEEQSTNGKVYDIEKDGLRIHTTLNYQIQQYADEAVKQHLKTMQQLLDREMKYRRTKEKWIKQKKANASFDENDFKPRKVELFDWDSLKTISTSRVDSIWHYHKMLHAAVLVTQPNTGEVLCWYGGNNYRYLPFDLVLSHRQIASAFKPILYATALENGYETNSYLENKEHVYEDYNDWQPQNFDLKSTPDSLVAFWYALAHSMNLPSVDLYFKTGPEKLVATCNKLGLPPITNDAPSIALGALDVSLYEIVRAYGVFATQGTYNDLVMIDKITDSKGKIIFQRPEIEGRKALELLTCSKLTDVLRTAINSGTGTKIRTKYGIKSDLAGKTGTAQNYSNAWFMSYTPNLVIGTWVGAYSPDIHFQSALGTGGSLALPISGQVIKNMEDNNNLRSLYLTNFSWPDSLKVFTNSAPYKSKKVGLFKQLFMPDKLMRPNPKPEPEIEKKKKGFRNILRNIFKQKDK